MNFKTNYQVDEAPVTNIERMLPAGLGMFGLVGQVARTAARNAGHAARNAGNAARNVAANGLNDPAARLACLAAAQVTAPALTAGCLLSRANNMPKVQGATLSKLLPISKVDEGTLPIRKVDTPTPDHKHLEQAESFESVKCDTQTPTNGEPANSQLKEDKGENDLDMEREKFVNEMKAQCASTEPETEFFATIVKQATTKETCNKLDMVEDKVQSNQSPLEYSLSFLRGGNASLEDIRSMREKYERVITDYVRSMREFFQLLKNHPVFQKNSDLMIHLPLVLSYLKWTVG